MTQKKHLSIIGINGRMGLNLIEILNTEYDLLISSGIVVQADENVRQNILKLDNKSVNPNLQLADTKEAKNIKKLFTDHHTDLIIDFSSPTATLACLKMTSHLKIPYIIGTTGFSEDEEKTIKKLANNHLVLKAGNFSLGINYLAALVEKASRDLKSSEWNIEIIERHHNQKLDAPSGTATMLLEAACRGRKWQTKKIAHYGRHHAKQKRREDEIGISAVRGGGVIGEHTVSFMAGQEEIILKHCAFNRNAFSSGVVKAIRWCLAHCKNKVGLYSMKDIFEI